MYLYVQRGGVQCMNVVHLSKLKIYKFSSMISYRCTERITTNLIYNLKNILMTFFLFSVTYLFLYIRLSKNLD